jgi:hypothetical protein
VRPLREGRRDLVRRYSEISLSSGNFDTIPVSAEIAEQVWSKKHTRRGSNISVSRRAVLCRQDAHRQFAAGLAWEQKYVFLTLVRTFGMIMLAENLSGQFRPNN